MGITYFVWDHTTADTAISEVFETAHVESYTKAVANAVLASVKYPNTVFAVSTYDGDDHVAINSMFFRGNRIYTKGGN